MRFLTLKEILITHDKIIEQSGGSKGIRDLPALLSAINQPFTGFGDKYLYPTLFEKATALAYSLIMNHPFVDGNKRIGHAALEITLYLNGYEIIAGEEEQEEIILSLAAGKLKREDFFQWLSKHITPL